MFTSLFVSPTQDNMDTSGSEYEQPLLVSLNPMSTDLRAQSDSRQPSSIRKRKRSAEHDSSRVSPDLPLNQSIFYETNISHPGEEEAQASAR